jgi:large subunit ribosomal protein L11
MPKETIEVLVEGGKATAAPPLGPALGPMGVNISQVVAKINEKTAEFKGMQVPVKVIIDSETKKFDIEVGTPPASALIKKEAGIEKGAGNPLTDKVADLAIEQVIKIAKMKEGNLLGKDNIMKVKEIIGTCNSMGVMVEGRPAHETIRDINAGKFKDEILKGKTELSAEEMKALQEEKKKLAAEIEARRHEFEAKADEILKSMAGKTRGEIKAKMTEAEIPMVIINEKLPVEEAVAGAAGAPAEKKEEAPKEKK